MMRPHLKAVGRNPGADFLFGLKPARLMLLAMLFEGGFAGFAGNLQVTAVYHRLIPAISNNCGYLALLVVMLANYNIRRINLSLDGSILLAAMASFVVALKAGSLLAGFVAGALVGAAVAAAVAVFSIFLRQNQVAVGFVLTLITRDLAYFLGNPYSRLQKPRTAPAPIPGLDQIPFLGPVLFNHPLPVYFSVALIGTAQAGRGVAALFIGNGAGGVKQALSAGLSQGRARKSPLDIVWPNG